MKKAIIFIFIIAATITIISCSILPVSKNNEIPKDMTGSFDIFEKLRINHNGIIVYGTKGSEKETNDLQWLAEATNSYLHWISKKDVKSINLPIKSDREVTDEDIINNHIILLGNPSTNSFYDNVNLQLPIRVQEGKLIAGNSEISNESTTFNYIIPNPLNKEKYLWVLGSLSNDYLRQAYDSSFLRSQDYEIKVSINEIYYGLFTKNKENWILEKLIPKENTLSKFKKVESEHFVFFYNPINSFAEDDIEKIVESRENFYNQCLERLNLKHQEKINYYMFLSDELKNTYTHYNYYRYDGSMVVDVYSKNNSGSDSYKYYITKTIMNQIGQTFDGMVPDALYLGYIRPGLDSDLILHLKAKNIIEGEEYIPLEYLNGYRYDNKLDSDVVYDELASFGNFLIKTYGIETYLELYKENITHKIDKSLYLIYNKDLLELEIEWIEYLNSLEMNE